MADRIVVRHQGVLHDLFTPQGTMKPVGGNDMKNGLILEEHMSPPGEFPETEFLTHIIVVKKGTAPVPLFWKENGRKNGRFWIPGGVGLSTAGLQAGIRWEGSLHVSVLRIGIPMMERALPEPFVHRPVELIPVRAGEPDFVLEHMIGALSAIFERYSSPARIAVESLCNAMSVYLAQHYGVFPLQVERYWSGLTQDRLSRVLDYIEAYLGEDLLRGGWNGQSRCYPRVHCRLRTLHSPSDFRTRANSPQSSSVTWVSRQAHMRASPAA